MIVSKSGLAALLGVSFEALRKRIAADPDFPVERAGSHGVAYRYDAERVIAYLEAKRRPAEVAQARALEQLALFGGAAPAAPAERLDLVRILTRVNLALDGLPAALSTRLELSAEQTAAAREVVDLVLQQATEASPAA